MTGALQHSRASLEGGFGPVWCGGTDLHLPLAVYQLKLRARTAILWLAWLLTQLGPQNRESIHTSFKRCFHEALHR